MDLIPAFMPFFLGNATIDGIIDNRSGLPEMIMSLPIGNAVYGVGFMLSPETLNWEEKFSCSLFVECYAC